MAIEDPDLFAAANAVDHLTLVPLFARWMFVPAFLADKWVPADRWQVTAEETALSSNC